MEFATTPTKSSSTITLTTPGIFSAVLVFALTNLAPILVDLTTAPYSISGIWASIPKIGSPKTLASKSTLAIGLPIYLYSFKLFRTGVSGTFQFSTPSAACA